MKHHGRPAVVRFVFQSKNQAPLGWNKLCALHYSFDQKRENMVNYNSSDEENRNVTGQPGYYIKGDVIPMSPCTSGQVIDGDDKLALFASLFSTKDPRPDASFKIRNEKIITQVCGLAYHGDSPEKWTVRAISEGERIGGYYDTERKKGLFDKKPWLDVAHNLGDARSCDFTDGPDFATFFFAFIDSPVKAERRTIKVCTSDGVKAISLIGVDRDGESGYRWFFDGHCEELLFGSKEVEGWIDLETGTGQLKAAN